MIERATERVSESHGGVRKTAFRASALRSSVSAAASSSSRRRRYLELVQKR